MPTPLPRLHPLALSLLCALPCWAQETSTTLERVEVTGSRIKRLEAETASAVQVLSRADIQRSGALNLSDLLRNLPAGNVGGIATDGPVDSTFGSAGISLRGLGVGSTLVLVNGRRVAPFGFGSASFVDTNSIPVDAIERIETLLDGASAIYGADAIGGVVNIILRKGFEGLVATAGAGQSSRSDGQSASLSLSWGKGNVANEGYNVFVTAAHREQDPVRARRTAGAPRTPTSAASTWPTGAPASTATTSSRPLPAPTTPTPPTSSALSPAWTKPAPR
ncbi:MAG: TonB-dependent receptor plug domain-containing protein [Inhella sp.]